MVRRAREGRPIEYGRRTGGLRRRGGDADCGRVLPEAGELAMAAVLNRKNTGYSRRRMPKTRTGKAIRFFECFSQDIQLCLASGRHRGADQVVRKLATALHIVGKRCQESDRRS